MNYTYLSVVFWTGLLALVVTAIQIIVCNYSEKEEGAMGIDIIRLLIMLGFFVWVGFLQTVNWTIS